MQGERLAFGQGSVLQRVNPCLQNVPGARILRCLCGGGISLAADFLKLLLKPTDQALKLSGLSSRQFCVVARGSHLLPQGSSLR